MARPLIEFSLPIRSFAVSNIRTQKSCKISPYLNKFHEPAPISSRSRTICRRSLATVSDNVTNDEPVTPVGESSVFDGSVSRMPQNSLPVSSTHEAKLKLRFKLSKRQKAQPQEQAKANEERAALQRLQAKLDVQRPEIGSRSSLLAKAIEEGTPHFPVGLKEIRL